MKQSFRSFCNSILLLLIILFVIGHTFYYVGSEHNVYYWDYNGYWRLWQDITLQIMHQPFKAFKFILASINSNDYNVLPVVVPTIFSGLPFSSRMSYILSLSVFYYIPVILLFSYIYYNFIASSERKFSDLVISLLLPATFVAFWIPILAGYPDICGLVFVLLALLYQFKFDIGNKIYIKKMLVLGILLWSPFLLRRWYAYTVVSLYISLPILNYFLFFDKTRIWFRMRAIIQNFLISGVTSFVFALAFQNGLIRRIVTTNYSDLYAAYQGGLGYSIKSLFNSCGYYVLPFVILGVLLCLFTKNIKQKSFIIFCVFNLLFSFFLFTRTQSPGEQHNLPFALWILFIVCYAVTWLKNLISSKFYSATFVTAIICCLGYIDQKSLFDRGGYTVLQDDFFPSKHLPLRVGNYQAYLDFTKDIKQLLGAKKTITVLSSNQILNDDMLNTLSDRTLSSQIVFASQVDTRDGIRANSFMSDYILLVDPPQTHMGETNQRVITIPVHNLMKHESIGQAYSVVGHGYKLDNNATAWIYKKDRSFTPSEVDTFFSQYYQYYPQWKELYSHGLMRAIFGASITKGDTFGDFSINDSNGYISAHPGEHTPTIVEWVLKNISKLRIQSTNNQCNQQDIIKVLISGENAPSKEVDIPHGGEVIVDMTPWQNILSRMVIEKNKSSGCDALRISVAQ